MNSPLSPLRAARLPVALLMCLLLALPAPLMAQGVPQLMNYQGRVTVGGVNHDGDGWFKFALVDGGSDQNRTAAATAVVSGSGRIADLTLTDGGRGYVTPPVISFGGTGTGATATAVLTGDTVTAVIVDKAGGGFSTVTPTPVFFTAPPPNIQTTVFWSNDGSAKEDREPENSVRLAVQKGLYSVMLGEKGLMEPLPAQVFGNEDVRLRVWFSAKEGEPFTLLTPDQRIAAVGYALMADGVKPGGITSEMLASNAITMAQLSPELRQTIQGLQAWQATQLPIVTSPLAAEAAVDQPFSYQIAATGLPTSYAVSGLPPGWTVNTATGLITAIPTAAGTVALTMTATNVAGLSAAKVLNVAVTGPVFVDSTTGNDSNAGTQAAPVQTLAQGLAIATSGITLRGVRVSGAVQFSQHPFALSGGVSVRGGYDRAAGWTRTGPRTPLSYSPLLGGDIEAAVVADNLTAPVLLDGFAITSAAGLGGGRSTVGVRIRNCPQTVTLSNNTITAAAGNAGLNGTLAAAGTDGADGWDAVSWRGPIYPSPLPQSSYQAIYYFGCGGTHLSAANFFGVDVDQGEGFPGKSGSAPGAAGGAPGSPNGSNGTDGSNGAGGSAGAHGAVAAGIQLNGNFSSTEGGQGAAGTAGSNGGDGGGGGGVGVNSLPYYGGGGGTGGKGGTAGAGGKGGKGGGGSFAVMVVNSSVTVTGCTLITGNGGTGGNGGAGALGGSGGQGGNGFVTPAVNGFNPGNGGDGGNGGLGGSGGGGAGGQGGPSIGIIASQASTLTQSGNTFTLGNAGSGGSGGARGTSASFAPAGPAGARQNVLTGVQP